MSKTHICCMHSINMT